MPHPLTGSEGLPAKGGAWGAGEELAPLSAARSPAHPAEPATPQESENLLTYKRRMIEHMLQIEASQKPQRVLSPEEMLQG